MTVAGPKERQIAELRRRRALPPHVDHLLADGCPPELVILPGEPRNRRPKIDRRRADAGVALAPPLAVQKAIAADLKDEPEPRASDATARAMIDAVDGPKVRLGNRRTRAQNYWIFPLPISTDIF